MLGLHTLFSLHTLRRENVVGLTNIALFVAKVKILNQLSPEDESITDYAVRGLFFANLRRGTSTSGQP